MRESEVTISEQELVARSKQGDRQACEELFDRHRAALRSWIRIRTGARLRHKVTTEDILQETFLRAFESVGRFVWCGEGSFRRWLCAIAEHLIWNVAQRRSTGELRLTIDPAKSGVSPSRHERRVERLDRLESSLASLRPEERDAIRLSRIDGLKISEVAERLNKPEATVKSLIGRGLRNLKNLFGDTESLNLSDSPSSDQGARS